MNQETESAKKDKTVMVTGGSGYVAGWCMVRLLEQGYTVRATLRSLKKEAAVRATIAKAFPDTSRLSFVEADLTSDAGWDAAMQGVDYVLHVASPMTSAGKSSDPDALIRPARDGAVRVLKAALQANVRRVVMTSSMAAATPYPLTDTLSDETVWTNPATPNINAYRLSKLYAEQAAWDFMLAHGSREKLVTILPAAIFGPVLDPDASGSVDIFRQLLAGQMPALPRLAFNVVDVRDLADLHVRAMTAPNAAGERFLASGDIGTQDGVVWMKDIAAILKESLGEQARKVPTRNLPDVVFRIAARFNPELQQMVPLIGRRQRFSSAKAAKILGYQPRPLKETVVETAKSLADS